MTAVALALAASLFWGVGDFLGGVTSRRLPVLGVLAISQVAGFTAIALVALVFGDDFPSTVGIAAAVAAGVAGVVGLGGLYRGMAVGAMGVVAPISASAAVIPVVVGLARGERPATIQLVGITLALLGVVLVSREPGSTAGSPRAFRSRSSRPPASGRTSSSSTVRARTMRSGPSRSRAPRPRRSRCRSRRSPGRCGCREHHCPS